MSLPDWKRVEDWEVLRLGGIRIPGVAKVTGGLGSGLDVKKPKGGKKATIKDEGDPPAELDVELSMDHDDVVAFANVLPVLRAVTKNGARDPLKVEHPMAMLANVHNATVGDIEMNHPEPGGRLKVTFKLIEWAPAPAPVADSKKQPKADNDEADWARFADKTNPKRQDADPFSRPVILTAPIYVRRKPSQNAKKDL